MQEHVEDNLNLSLGFKSDIRRKHREHGIQPLENAAAFEVEWGVAYFLHNQPAYLSECLHKSSKLSS